MPTAMFTLVKAISHYRQIKGLLGYGPQSECACDCVNSDRTAPC